jgi:hypothetical protein
MGLLGSGLPALQAGFRQDPLPIHVVPKSAGVWLDGSDQCSLHRSTLHAIRLISVKQANKQAIYSTCCCIAFYYLRLPECSLDHIIPILINQDVKQPGVVDELKDDPRAFSLRRFSQALLDHVAAALLRRQVPIAALKLVQYLIRCPGNPEPEHELYHVVPAAISSLTYRSERAKKAAINSLSLSLKAKYIYIYTRTRTRLLRAREPEL